MLLSTRYARGGLSPKKRIIVRGGKNLGFLVFQPDDQEERLLAAGEKSPSVGEIMEKRELQEKVFIKLCIKS